MKTRIRIILIAVTALVFGASIFSVSSAQKSFSDTAQPGMVPSQNIDNEPAPAVKLGPFSHRRKEHGEGKPESCEKCHKMPTTMKTKNWATARKDPYPDVTTYPYHTSCFDCHNKEIYTAGSGFCGTCHVVDDGRRAGGSGVLPFPIKSHSRQFRTVFPHDVHQNLIAKNTVREEVAIGHFVLASFTAAATPTPTTPESKFYNCAICHKTMQQMPKATPRIITREQSFGVAQPDAFVPPPDPATTQPAPAFFKNGPDSHASCFTCHYQRVKPAAYDCAGCHKLTEPYFEKKGIERYSIKFNHSSTNHVNKDCTVCHVRITQNSDVSKMKDADVPFQTCSTSSCHGSNIQEEIKNREASVTNKQKVFQCSYCHTTAVGRYDIPPSHRKY